jgi:hypothetical protein
MARREATTSIVLGALAMLAAPSLASAQAPPTSKTLSKTEARALPPGELTQRVMDQVADLLTPSDPPPRPGRKPTRPLRDLAFQTAPRATWAPGVCARDSVIVSFAPAGPEHGADTAMRAASLKATTSYRLLALPVREDDYYDGPPPPAAREACAKLSGDDEPFVAAPTAEAALSGGWWLGKLAKDAAAASPPFVIDCGLAANATETCPTILSRLTLADLRGVTPCLEDRHGAEPLRCWALDVWPGQRIYEIKLLTNQRVGDGAAIVRVEVAEQVLIGDTVID